MASAAANASLSSALEMEEEELDEVAMRCGSGSETTMKRRRTDLDVAAASPSLSLHSLLRAAPSPSLASRVVRLPLRRDLLSPALASLTHLMEIFPEGVAQFRQWFVDATASNTVRTLLPLHFAVLAALTPTLARCPGARAVRRGGPRRHQCACGDRHADWRVCAVGQVPGREHRAAGEPPGRGRCLGRRRGAGLPPRERQGRLHGGRWACARGRCSVCAEPRDPRRGDCYRLTHTHTHTHTHTASRSRTTPVAPPSRCCRSRRYVRGPSRIGTGRWLTVAGVRSCPMRCSRRTTRASSTTSRAPATASRRSATRAGSPSTLRRCCRSAAP